MLRVRGSRTTKHEWTTDFSGVEIANVIGRIKYTFLMFVECNLLLDVFGNKVFVLIFFYEIKYKHLPWRHKSRG